VAVAGAVLVAAVGCGGEEVAAPGGGDPLAGRTFLSETVTREGTAIELVDGTRISIEFSDGELVARAGCNTLLTDVRIGAGRLETGLVGGTELGCDPARHEQDQWLSEFLASSPAWALDGDRLTLTASTAELVLLDRRVADPDRPLAGVRWVVDTIVTGETASSLAAGTEGSAWLLIEAETFQASSGCRDIEGRVRVTERRLAFSDAVQTDPVCPPELVGVDEVLAAIVTGEVDYRIEADRLTVDHPDGVGLGLHAGG
jgi:heat shock protein HslJ